MIPITNGKNPNHNNTITENLSISIKRMYKEVFFTNNNNDPMETVTTNVNNDIAIVSRKNWVFVRFGYPCHRYANNRTNANCYGKIWQ